MPTFANVKVPTEGTAITRESGRLVAGRARLVGGGRARVVRIVAVVVVVGRHRSAVGNSVG